MTDIAGAARYAAAFIDALELKQVDLLGWSMGGAVAQQLALDRPDLVRRIVLASFASFAVTTRGQPRYYSGQPWPVPGV